VTRDLYEAIERGALDIHVQSQVDVGQGARAQSKSPSGLALARRSWARNDEGD